MADNKSYSNPIQAISDAAHALGDIVSSLPHLLDSNTYSKTVDRSKDQPTISGEVTGAGQASPQEAAAANKNAPPPAPEYARNDFKQKLSEFFSSTLGNANPARNNLPGYFPILQHLPDLQKAEQTSGRPGLANLLALQSLFESGGGRTPNTFGVRPPGGSSFPNIPSAINYQVGPNVLGGGQSGKLNLLSGKTGPITPDEIQNLYKSYNPNSPYVDRMIETYKSLQGM